MVVEQGSNIWITGASSGLGAALAREFSAQGAQLALSARTEEKLEAVNRSLDRPGMIFPCDVTDDYALTTTVQAIVDRMQHLDIAILNAGTYNATPLLELDVEDTRALFDINFFSVVRAIQLLVPVMKAQGRGHLVVISSVAGDVGLPYAAAYSASKSALNRLCESLHPELDKYGIKISLVSPGFVKTPLTDKNEFPMPFRISAEEAAKAVRKGIEKNRFEIRFPFTMAFIMRRLAHLPKRILLSITKRMLRKDESS